MSIRPRSLAVNLALLVASTALALVAAEAVLHAIPGLLPEEARIRLFWARLEGNVQTVGHPYAGFTYRPHTRIEEHGGELDWGFMSDEHGFRNADPWPDSTDIVVLGDSQALGYGVSTDEAWPELVARGLGAGLIDLAIAGIAPEQERRIYETFGATLRPHWVLFGVFPGNDFSDARQFQDWLDAGSPGSFAAWRSAGGTESHGLRRVVQRSYLAAVVRLGLRGGWNAAQGLTITVPDGSELVLAPSFVEREARRAEPSRGNFELVMSAIEKAHAEVTGAGGRFVVVLFPTKEEVYMPPRGLEVPDLVGAVADALERRSIPYLDLLPAFRSATGKGVPLFFTVDGHPNARGNAAIADAVMDYIRSQDARRRPPAGTASH